MGVSNRHAIISKKNNLFFIEDLNSSNGTFVNSQKISSQQRVTPQDTIIIGKHTLRFSEWSHMQDTISKVSHQEKYDATIIMRKNETSKNKQTTPLNPQKNAFYLILRGELKGVKKLLLTENIYGIGKAKDNEIRVGGWFTASYIAEIEKTGHSFYISPIKRHKVKLNNNKISSSTLLSHSDEIKTKNLFLKFLID